jgi:hypothetical protein
MNAMGNRARNKIQFIAMLMSKGIKVSCLDELIDNGFEEMNLCLYLNGLVLGKQRFEKSPASRN